MIINLQAVQYAAYLRVRTDNDKSIKVLEQAQKIAPDDPSVMGHLASTYARSTKYECILTL